MATIPIKEAHMWVSAHVHSCIHAQKHTNWSMKALVHIAKYAKIPSWHCEYGITDSWVRE